MKHEYDYFIIDKEHLKDKKVFPFQVFIFNPSNKKFSLFLNGNRPLTNELSQFLDYILDKGGKLAVLKKQQKTFLTAQESLIDDIPALKNAELHALEKERLMNIKYKEIFDEKHGSFSLQSEFEKACEKDDFQFLIDHARIDILTFSVSENSTVSLAIELAKKHLHKDNFLNRVVATAYLMAKNMDIVDYAPLAEIVCGTYLSHLGLSQIPLNYSRTPYMNLGDKEKTLFQKHTILGHHLLKKSQIDLSEKCKKIILDHHERPTGSGYPSMKYGDSIDQFSQLIGAVFHLFELSSGKINSSKPSMKSIIINIKNKSYVPGLELDFSDSIYNCIITLINTEKITEKENSALKAAA